MPNPKRIKLQGKAVVPRDESDDDSSDNEVGNYTKPSFSSSEGEFDSEEVEDSEEVDDDSEDGLEDDDDDEEAEQDDDEDIEEDAEAEEGERQDPSSGFNKAMDAILGSKVKAHDRENPILIRNKKSAKEIEEAKLDAKARRLLRLEKIQNKDRARVKDVIPANVDEAGQVLQQEKQFKKIAQRGVVRLFNAIHASQKAESSVDSKSLGVDKRAQEATDVSKETFLDMIRSG